MEYLNSDDPECFEMLVCQVCFENMVEREPRTLACNHTFCTSCLTKIVADGIIQCPTCRRSSHLKQGGILSLPINFSLAKVQEREKVLVLNLEKLCQSCILRNSKQKATVTCVDCSRIMCNDCKNSHDQKSVFQQHTMKPLVSETKPLFCKNHNQTAAYVCHQCQNLLCVDCVLSGDHGDHDDSVENLDTGANTIRRKIEDKITKLSKVLENVMAVSNETKQELALCKQVEEKMQKKASVLIQDIQKKLAENLDLFRRDYNKRVNSNLKSQNDLMAGIESLIKTLRTKSESATEDILISLADINEFLSSIKPDTMDVPGKTTYDITYLLVPTIEVDATPVKLKSSIMKDRIQVKKVLDLSEIEGNQFSRPIQLHAVGADSVMLVDWDLAKVFQMHISGKTIASYGDFLPNDKIKGVGSFGNNIYISHSSENKNWRILCINASAGKVALYQPNQEKVKFISQLVCIDGDTLAVVDPVANAVHAISISSRQIETVLEKLNYPTFISIAYDTKGQTRYLVTEKTEHRVCVYDDNWKYVCTLGGKRSPGSSSMLNDPAATAPVSHTDSVLVADTNNHRVSMFCLDGTFQKHVLTEADGLRFPLGLAYMAPYLWVTEAQHAGVGAHVKCYRFE